MIKIILTLLQSNDWINAGEYTEIAKGKHELVSTIKGGKRKIKRVWQSKG
jgi:hypothetical protein